MFIGDQPIVNKEADLLDRAEYAKKLAEAIAKSKNDSGLVCAIYGNWGSGKTSFKNLLKKELPKNVEALEFSPWRWSGEDVLFDRFFDEIGKSIGSNPKYEEISNKWLLYGTYLKLGSSITKSFGIISSFFGPTGLAVGTTAGMISALMSKSADTISQAEPGLKAKDEISKKKLDDIVKDLKQELSNIENPIIIFIDDIDRLTVQEIRLLFTLIKANSVFPNLIFVLLFQRDLVEKALAEQSPNQDGASYLEKIVQVGIDLPSLDKNDLEKILFFELDKILDSDPETLSSWKEKYEHDWGNLYHGGLKELFSSIRQIYRFVNSFQFYFSGFLSARGGLEVNPVDLVALEAIRIFQPTLYLKLRSYKEMLTNTALLIPDDKAKEYNALLENLTAEIPAECKSKYQDILKRIFPVFSYLGARDDDSSYQLRRVSHSAYFDRYFKFSLLSKDISQYDIGQLLTLRTASEFTLKIQEYITNGQTNQLLEAIESYKSQISEESIIGLFSGLFGAGDAFYPEYQLFYTPMSRAYRTIKFILKTLPQEKRGDIFKSAIEQAGNGIYVAARYIHEEENEVDRNNFPNEFAFQIEELKQFKDGVCKRIEEMAKNGSLIKSPALYYLLFAWQRWGSESFNKSNFFNKELSSLEGLSSILLSFKTKSLHTTGGDHVPKEIEGMNVQAMNNLGILEKVDASIKSFSGKNDSEFQSLVELFNKAKEEFEKKKVNNAPNSVMQIS